MQKGSRRDMHTYTLLAIRGKIGVQVYYLIVIDLAIHVLDEYSWISLYVSILTKATSLPSSNNRGGTTGSDV